MQPESTTAHHTINASAASRLPVTTATKMKRQGWRSIMADVRREGSLLITNHQVPEAVILPPEHYDRLVASARKTPEDQEDPLERLRARFRERMKVLRAPGNHEKLARVMLHPVDLGGRVIAGE